MNKNFEKNFEKHLLQAILSLVPSKSIWVLFWKRYFDKKERKSIIKNYQKKYNIGRLQAVAQILFKLYLPENSVVNETTVKELCNLAGISFESFIKRYEKRRKQWYKKQIMDSYSEKYLEENRKSMETKLDNLDYSYKNILQ